MLYTHALTVPAGTSEASPVEADLILTAGVLTRIEADFAPGCHRSVFVYVRQGLHQVWPLNPDGKVRGNEATIGSAEYTELTAAENILTVGGYAPDAAYDHVILFRLEVTPYEVAERGAKLDSWTDKLMHLLGVK